MVDVLVWTHVNNARERTGKEYGMLLAPCLIIESLVLSRKSGHNSMDLENFRRNYHQIFPHTTNDRFENWFSLIHSQSDIQHASNRFEWTFTFISFQDSRNGPKWASNTSPLCFQSCSIQWNQVKTQTLCFFEIDHSRLQYRFSLRYISLGKRWKVGQEVYYYYGTKVA